MPNIFISPGGRCAVGNRFSENDELMNLTWTKFSEVYFEVWGHFEVKGYFEIQTSK